MHTTQGAVQVALDAEVEGLEQLLYAQRASLPHARNGKSRPPSSAYAAQVLKDMKQGKSQEFRRIMAVLLTNLADGVPLHVVRLVPERMARALEFAAGEGRPRPVRALNLMETHAD